eukprot:1996328-Prymnesium_polylepis.1
MLRPWAAAASAASPLSCGSAFIAPGRVPFCPRSDESGADEPDAIRGGAAERQRRPYDCIKLESEKEEEEQEQEEEPASPKRRRNRERDGAGGWENKKVPSAVVVNLGR